MNIEYLKQWARQGIHSRTKEMNADHPGYSSATSGRRSAGKPELPSHLQRQQCLFGDSEGTPQRFITNRLTEEYPTPVTRLQLNEGQREHEKNHNTFFLLLGRCTEQTCG
ncbi:hypothetical protein TNCV_3043561 [Trichonephila clavipes]|nr:hypothetical protein TNCV_3043561 [Trichonephila clavipes]